MQLTQVPWDCSSRFSMPVAAWREMMEAHYPFRGWVALDRTTVERLEHVKAERALPTIDATVAELLDDGTDGDA